MVEAEPKKPQPLAHGGGEGAPWRESPGPLSVMSVDAVASACVCAEGRVRR